jgi:hypothetical protein
VPNRTGAGRRKSAQEAERGEFRFGRWVWERLRTEQPALAARLVFVSGDSVSEETRAFLHSTGRPLLRKPFALDRLEAVLAEVARGECAVADALG